MENVRAAERALQEQQRRLQAEQQHLAELQRAAQAAEQELARVNQSTRDILARVQQAVNEERRARETLEIAGKRESELLHALSLCDVASLSTQDVCDILLELRLGHHKQNFEANGIDGEVLVTLSDEELKEIGLQDDGERVRLRHAVGMINACGQLRVTASALERNAGKIAGDPERNVLLLVTWDAANTARWLEMQKVPAPVCAVLSSRGVTGEKLLHITAKDLRDFGIASMGDRKKLLNCVETARKLHFSALSTVFGKAPATSAAPSPNPSTSSAAASSSSESSEVPHMFKCPISLEIMTNPVSAPDGFIYEESEIRRWLQSHNTSPMTNQPMAAEPLVRCNTVRSAIAEWRQHH